MSAQTGEGLEELKERVTEEFEKTLKDVELLVPFSEGGLLSELHDVAGEMEREDTPEACACTLGSPPSSPTAYSRYAVNGQPGET